VGEEREKQGGHCRNDETMGFIPAESIDITDYSGDNFESIQSSVTQFVSKSDKGIRIENRESGNNSSAYKSPKNRRIPVIRMMMAEKGVGEMSDFSDA